MTDRPVTASLGPGWILTPSLPLTSSQHGLADLVAQGLDWLFTDELRVVLEDISELHKAWLSDPAAWPLILLGFGGSFDDGFFAYLSQLREALRQQERLAFASMRIHTAIAATALAHRYWPDLALPAGISPLQRTLEWLKGHKEDAEVVAAVDRFLVEVVRSPYRTMLLEAAAVEVATGIRDATIAAITVARDRLVAARSAHQYGRILGEMTGGVWAAIIIEIVTARVLRTLRLIRRPDVDPSPQRRRLDLPQQQADRATTQPSHLDAKLDTAEDKVQSPTRAEPESAETPQRSTPPSPEEVPAEGYQRPTSPPVSSAQPPPKRRPSKKRRRGRKRQRLYSDSKTSAPPRPLHPDAPVDKAIITLDQKVVTADAAVIRALGSVPAEVTALSDLDLHDLAETVRRKIESYRDDNGNLRAVPEDDLVRIRGEVLGKAQELLLERHRDFQKLLEDAARRAGNLGYNSDPKSLIIAKRVATVETSELPDPKEEALLTGKDPAKARAAPIREAAYSEQEAMDTVILAHRIGPDGRTEYMAMTSFQAKMSNVPDVFFEKDRLGNKRPELGQLGRDIERGGQTDLVVYLPRPDGDFDRLQIPRSQWNLSRKNTKFVVVSPKKVRYGERGGYAHKALKTLGITNIEHLEPPPPGVEAMKGFVDDLLQALSAKLPVTPSPP